MFIVVVFTFAVCWLPYHAYFVYTYHDRSIVYKKWVQHLYLSFYFLAMSTSCWNPTIIFLMNTRFREYVKGVFLNFLCCRGAIPPRRVPVTPPLLRRCSRSRSSRSGNTESVFHLNAFGVAYKMFELNVSSLIKSCQLLRSRRRSQVITNGSALCCTC